MKEWDKAAIIGKIKINSKHSNPNNLFGRFGGGWNWMLGFRVGGSTVILHFLVFDIRITKVREVL